MGPGGGAAVGGVAELVDVEPVQPRLQVGDLAGDTNGVGTRRNMLKREVRQYGVDFNQEISRHPCRAIEFVDPAKVFTSRNPPGDSPMRQR